MSLCLSLVLRDQKILHKSIAFVMVLFLSLRFMLTEKIIAKYVS